MQTLIPGAVLDPGVHWNYEGGIMPAINAIIWHYTVGVDSRAIGRRGYFALLIARDGTLYQFAPLDSVNWHACEWNWTTLGIEVESLDGSITDAQVLTLGYVSMFVMQQTGIPDLFYDEGRLPVGFPFYGITNHRDLHEVACDEHYDGFDRWVYDAFHTPAPPAPTPTPVPPPDWFDIEWEAEMAQTKGFFVTFQQDGAKFNGAAILCAEDAVHGHCSTWVRNGTEWRALLAAGALAAVDGETVDQAIFDFYPLAPGSFDPRDGTVVTKLTHAVPTG